MPKNDPNKEAVFLHNIAFIPISEKLKSLLILIAFRCQGDRKTCIQSDGAMGEILGASERTIRERLAELVSLGYVRVINPGSPRNRALEITPITLAAITSNTQEYISYVQEVSAQDKKELGENPPSKPALPSEVIGGNPPINESNAANQIGEKPPIKAAEIRLELGENPPSNTAEIHLQKKNSKINGKKKSKKEVKGGEIGRLVDSSAGFKEVAPEGCSFYDFRTGIQEFALKFYETPFVSEASLKFSFINFLREDIIPKNQNTPQSKEYYKHNSHI